MTFERLSADCNDDIPFLILLSHVDDLALVLNTSGWALCYYLLLLFIAEPDGRAVSP